MLTVTPPEVTPAITALFDIGKPTMPRAFNVLEASVRGQILVDDPARPTWAVVREATFGTLYLGGRLDAPLLAALVAHFGHAGEVGIGCWRDDPVSAMLPPDPAYDGTTLYFPGRSPQVALEPLQCQLPPGYSLEPRDARLFAQSFDRDATLASFGSQERVLHSTLGVMILHNGVVCCEAATGAPTHGRIEVGVTTAEAYRRRGFATSACAALIALCEAQGYAPWWDCAKHNRPSVRLARKLGFQNEQEYRYVCWAQRSAA